MTTISELIAQLQELQMIHGNVIVCLDNEYDGVDYIHDIKFVKKDNNYYLTWADCIIIE